MQFDEKTAVWREIPYITLSFCLRFFQPVEVPQHKVSALRGGLGEMLLQKNCVVNRNCEACRFQEGCIVWNAFYTPMRFKPDYMTGKESLGYLIECDNQETFMDAGHGFLFRLKLFGRNIPLFSQYLDAFWRLGQVGLGKNHAKFEIAAIFTEEEKPLLDENQIHMEYFQIHTVGQYVEARKKELSTKNSPEGIYGIQYLTPLALRKDRIDLEHFDTDAIWRAIHRKIQMISYFTENPVELEKLSEWPPILECESKKASIKRYSNTHGRGMELKGIEGYTIMEQIDEVRLEELLAGELFHIGRNNSFDFGRYQVLNVR